MNAQMSINRQIDHLISKYRIPGIQYAVVDRNGGEFGYEAGLADLTSGRPVARETTFMASSSTKVLTAAAVLQLVERQKIELDRRLSDYYSSHPYGERVTIRHLLSQTSGIPNPIPLKWLHLVEEHHTYNEESALQQAMHRSSKLLFAPGERYAYSNISYWILGKVIEAVSGCSYAAYLKENVFVPLGISDLKASFEVQRMDLHATGYQKRFSILGAALRLLTDGRLLGEAVKGEIGILPVYMNGPAYGGLICTAAGFAVFLHDLLQDNPRVISAATRDLFLQEQQAKGNRPTGMTLGWRIGRLGNEIYYGKPGGGPGFRSNVRIYPRSGIGVAWLANETGVNEQEMNSISDVLDRQWLVTGGGNSVPREA